jgi:glycine cleavage system H lipoate-binding protein
VTQGTVLEPVINDPYNSGWMIVIQMNKPAELNALLTAQAYRDLVAKK